MLFDGYDELSHKYLKEWNESLRIFLIHYPETRIFNLSVSEKIINARSIAGIVAENALFANPKPTIEELILAINHLDQIQRTVIENGGGTKLIYIRNLAENALDSLMASLVKYVEFIAQGDGDIILSAGIPLKKNPSPIGPLAAPQNVLVVPAPAEGSVILRWKAVKNKLAYKIQKSDATDPLQWQNFDNNIITKRSIEIGKLNSGQKLFWRVAAINHKGEGSWSDPACCRVP